MRCALILTMRFKDVNTSTYRANCQLNKFVHLKDNKKIFIKNWVSHCCVKFCALSRPSWKIYHFNHTSIQQNFRHEFIPTGINFPIVTLPIDVSKTGYICMNGWMCNTHHCLTLNLFPFIHSRFILVLFFVSQISYFFYFFWQLYTVK